MAKPLFSQDDYQRIAAELREWGGVMSTDAADMVEALGRLKKSQATEKRKPWYKVARKRGWLV